MWAVSRDVTQVGRLLIKSRQNGDQMNRQEMKSISYEVYKAERERREELEVVAAALYLGHDDAKEQMEMYREVYILQPHGADGTCETGDCGPKPVVKHDPHCDCGICPYCNGLEDVFGRETNPAPQAYREKAIEAAADAAWKRDSGYYTPEYGYKKGFRVGAIQFAADREAEMVKELRTLLQSNPAWSNFGQAVEGYIEKLEGKTNEANERD